MAGSPPTSRPPTSPVFRFGAADTRSRPPGMPLHIETNGFVLRTLVPDDVTERFTQWLNASAMLEGLNISSPDFTMQRLRQFVASFDSLHNYFVGIFEQKSSLLIGFYTLDVDLRHRLGTITAGIGEPGYAERRVYWRTIDAFLDHMFAYRDIDKIVARVLAKNKAMLFNFVGNPRFIFEGCLRKECLAPDGERVDMMLFSAFRNASKEEGTLP